MSAMLQTISLARRRDDPQPGNEWDTSAYLAEYYSRVEPTEELTLAFLREALLQVDADARALDFGAGPTLHHALLLCGHVRELHVADYLPQNLRAMRRWLANGAGAHDWSAFTRAALRLEGNPAPGPEVVRQREALARYRITRALAADARQRHPLGEEMSAGYDCVTSFFCADSFTANVGEWMSCTRNIARLVAPGGLLVLAALRRCSSWRLGATHMPSPCIDERHMQYALDAAGFDRAAQEIRVAEVPDQAHHGFDSILLVKARCLRDRA